MILPVVVLNEPVMVLPDVARPPDGSKVNVNVPAICEVLYVAPGVAVVTLTVALLIR